MVAQSKTQTMCARYLSSALALAITLFCALAFFAVRAEALLPQTERDLQGLEDQLRTEVEKAGIHLSERMPVLVAPPSSYWDESRADFAPRINELLQRVLGKSGPLIPCADCRQGRSLIDHDGRLNVHNGELGLTEFAILKALPEFREAQSLLTVQETPGGIFLRWVSLSDGRILFSTLADSTQTLDKTVPRLNLARELERRKNGESLSYVFIDVGLYPQGLAQLSFLEQWGSRNQFITGLSLAVLNPTGAFGGTFLYMLPWQRKSSISASVFYSLKGLASSSDSQDSFGKSLTGQMMYRYTLGNSFGLFASANTDGVISAGFSLFNPLLFPFLL